MKKDTFTAELLSFEDLMSRCGFFESGNVAFELVLTAQFGKYMAIFDEGDRIELPLGEKIKNKRSNEKLGINILLF